MRSIAALIVVLLFAGAATAKPRGWLPRQAWATASLFAYRHLPAGTRVFKTIETIALSQGLRGNHGKAYVIGAAVGPIHTQKGVLKGGAAPRTDYFLLAQDGTKRWQVVPTLVTPHVVQADRYPGRLTIKVSQFHPTQLIVPVKVRGATKVGLYRGAELARKQDGSSTLLFYRPAAKGKWSGAAGLFGRLGEGVGGAWQPIKIPIDVKLVPPETGKGGLVR